MAKAKLNKGVVVVTLELTAEEAMLIAAFTGQVCGVGGPQNITTNIYRALGEVGMGSPYGNQGEIRIIPTSRNNIHYRLEWANADKHGNTFHP